MARLKAVLIAGLIGTVAVAGPAAAQEPLPTGENDGVRIVRERGAIVVVFTKPADRLWRRVAGRRVSVMCDEMTGPDEDGISGVNSGGAAYRTPKRGRRIRTGDLTRGMDLCTVTLLPYRVHRRDGVIRHGRQRLVTIPLTQKGAIRLDEWERTQALYGVLLISSLLAHRGDAGSYLTGPALVEALPVLKRPLRLPIVVLTGPDETPPAGSLGYYSDGAEHAASVILSATGRRLFIESEPGGVLRTNVAGYMFDNDPRP